jgi:hypothetical protein
MCAGSIAWNVNAVGPQYSVEIGGNIGLRPFLGKDVGLETDPLWDRLHREAVAMLQRLQEPDLQPWVWRAPIWIYLADLAVVVAAIRRRRALILLVAAPMLAQQVGVAFISPAQDARYMFASLMLGFLLLPIAFIRNTPRAGDDIAGSEGESGAPETRATSPSRA